MIAKGWRWFLFGFPGWLGWRIVPWIFERRIFESFSCYGYFTVGSRVPKKGGTIVL